MGVSGKAKGKVLEEGKWIAAEVVWKGGLVHAVTRLVPEGEDGRLPFLLPGFVNLQAYESWHARCWAEAVNVTLP